MGTQTDWVAVKREVPVVNFLDADETELKESNVPNCFHFASSREKTKSPKIPIVVEGVRVPILLDTGAQVSVLSTKFMQSLFPNSELETGTQEVRTLGGKLFPIKGPVKLKVEICGLVLDHPFYHCEEIPTFIMGFELIRAAALTIDTLNGCVWSEHTSEVLQFRNLVTKTVPPVRVTRNNQSLEVTAPADGSRVVEQYDFRTDTDRPMTLTVEFHNSPHALVSLDVYDCNCKRFDNDLAFPLSHRGDDVSSELRVEAEPFCPQSSTDSTLHVVETDCVENSCVLPIDSPSLSYVDQSNAVLVPKADVACGADESFPSRVSDIDSVPTALSTLSPFLDRQLDEDLTSLKTPVSESGRVESCDENELPEHVSVLFLQTLENASLTSDVKQGLKTLLSDHQDTFATSSADLGYCKLLEHDIDTGEHPPIRQSPRRPPLAARDAEDEILDEMLASGVIEPSTSPWASPVCLVRKKDGSFRFCVDYRRVNAVSKKDAYPVPDIQDALDHLRGARYFATFDLLSGYWQLGLTERARERSAFCTRRGLFNFTRMPFGLCGAPSTFCRLMENVLHDLRWAVCLYYLDDIIIFARTPQELLQRLRMVLDRLREVGLKVKPTKCTLFQTEVQFLGHQVSENGIEPLADKIETIQNWPVPHCIRDVRAFFGLASYYRKFVRDFALIAEPLTRLTRKQTRFEWSDEAQEAFEKLKKALAEATSLAFPYPNRPCILDTDASDVAIGAVLSQNIDGVERPIAFYSRILNSTQHNYCTTRRELLAVISALQHFRHYLLGAKIILRTDHHSLKWLQTFKRPEGILARWVETLAEFNFEIVHRPGRLHNNVDGVSRPFCKQCIGKTFKIPWVDELERADELTEPLGVHIVSLPEINVVTVPQEISNEVMSELQHEDLYLGKVLEWLEDEYQPTRDELRAASLEVRNLWAQRPQIAIHDQLLVRKIDDAKIQLVVPTAVRRQLFDNVHAGPLAAHLGPERCLHQLKQYYFWPGMRKDVDQWYAKCPDCARSKGNPTRHRGKLQKVVTGAPMDIVAVDILSGLPETPDGLKYILVISDYFTKYSQAFALPDAEASTCMRVMFDGFFSLFGLPLQLHSDQGRNFEGKLFHELCKLAGIKKSRTTAFHPQSDGQVERLNRTLLQMLRTTVDENPKSWPQRLPTLMGAYRATVHKVTGVTPNFAMLGRETLLPATLIARPPEEPFQVTVPFVSNLRDTLRDAHERVRQATQSVARTQKKYHDEHVKGHNFKLNDLVYLFWPRPPIRQKYKKLTQLWTGPWKITNFRSSVVVEIQDEKTKARQRVHIDRLTPCQVRPTNTATTTAPAVVEAPEHQAVTESTSVEAESSSRPRRTHKLPKALEPYLLG